MCVGDLVSFPFLQSFIIFVEHKFWSFVFGGSNDGGLTGKESEENGNILVRTLGRGKLIIIIGLTKIIAVPAISKR